MDHEERLQALAKEIGYPSATKLWKAVQRYDLPINRKEVDAFVSKQSVRQVFKQRPRYDGKIAAVEINDRWAADLIDYTAKPSVGSDDRPSDAPFQYILIVQDIFSRKLFVHALRSKTPEIVEQAFQSIVRRAGLPDRLDTDDGPEFKGPFQQYLDEEHIYHVIADQRSKNARATLDAAIRVFRTQLARIQAQEGHRNWASLVQRAANAYNDTEHDALIGRAPDDVADDKDLQFSLEERAANNIAFNTAKIEKRADRLTSLGAFRVEEHPKDFQRSFNPTYKDEVHKIGEVNGPFVTDEHGQLFPTRHVLAVHPDSTAIDTTGMRSGSEQTNRLRLESLEPFRAAIEQYVGDGKWEFEVAAHMKTLGMSPLMKNGMNFRKALLLLGYSVDARSRVTKP